MANDIDNTNMNESNFIITSKRKRGESSAEYMSTNAPLRHKVLEFIDKKGSVTEKEMEEFLTTISEELGRTPSKNWLKNNKHLVDFKVNEDGSKTFKLSKRAKTILNTHRKFENMKEDMKKQIVSDLKGFRPRINDKISFDDVLTGKGVNKVSESKIATGYVYSNAAMRNKILEFIDKKGKVTLAEMKNFFKTLNEDIGKTPSSSYLSNNKHLIDRSVDANGISTYSLTNQGKHILKQFKEL